MYIILGESKFKLNKAPSSFADLKNTIQDTYSLFPDCYDYFILKSDQEIKLDEKSFPSFIDGMSEEEDLIIKLVEKKTDNKLKERVENNKEAELNTLLNALLTLSVIDSSIDISKIFLQEKPKANHELISKKAKSFKNTKSNDFKDYKFIAKSKS